ncbi:MAG TPA: chemotaxis protein CheB [Stellaceae bacterium]
MASDNPNRIVTIGASAGGIESLRAVVAGIPGDCRAAIFVVLHVPPYDPSALPEIIGRSGPLPVSHAEDGERIRARRIYVAPPDHHMLLSARTISVTKGPKENRFRPSIDALFRSAAYSFGAKVVGVVLSGALDDGTSGLWSIKRLGGISVVQDPKDARFESMPLSAMEQVKIDYKLKASAIGPLIGKLSSKKAAIHKTNDPTLRKRLSAEMKIAAEAGAFQKGIMDWGELTPFTCPECHGALVKLKEGNMTRYRCHTGHAYSDSSLLEDVMEHTGEMLWQVMRSMEEAVMLLRHLGEHMEERGFEKRASVFLSKARDIERRTRAVREAALANESLSTENMLAAKRKTRL